MQLAMPIFQLVPPNTVLLGWFSLRFRQRMLPAQRLGQSKGAQKAAPVLVVPLASLRFLDL